MKTTLHTDWTVGDICKGFVFDKTEGWEDVALCEHACNGRIKTSALHMRGA